MQLWVGDLTDDDVRRALSRQVVRGDGRSSIELIAERSLGFGGVVGTGQLVPIAPTGRIDEPAVFLTSEGPMLHEACHRVCGLYEARLETFDLRLRVDALFGSWLIIGRNARYLWRVRVEGDQADPSDQDHRDEYGSVPAAVIEETRHRRLRAYARGP